MQVILTSVRDPNKMIVAIANLRESTRGEKVGDVMNLREARDIVYAVRDGQPTPVAVKSTVRLDASFTWYPTASVPTPEAVSAQLVVDFLFDALACSDPASAQRIMALPTYKALKEAL